MKLFLALLFATALIAADDFPITEDSKPHDGIPRGELIKATYTAKADSLFPGTEREYAIYLPPNLDKTKPAPFMVFQDGVIYQAPTVFDNLIARKEIPPLIGIFIKPGIVPAANPDALPRYNRSYEYDSVTDNYARFLIDEFLPAIQAKHSLNLSDDPNARAIAGNSSGGICAFMVAWHRPDQFRRVFTGVGTYVGIHGADQLPVLVRKYEPKPLRVYLQSGENDNNLYCGDWWLANQMMERSLTWNGYEVNHTWGTGGHNAKHATQLFPDVLRWLWKGYPSEPVKANPRGDAKWRGYEVIGNGEWKEVPLPPQAKNGTEVQFEALCADKSGTLFISDPIDAQVVRVPCDVAASIIPSGLPERDKRYINHLLPECITCDPGGQLWLVSSVEPEKGFVAKISPNGKAEPVLFERFRGLAIRGSGQVFSNVNERLSMMNESGGWKRTSQEIDGDPFADPLPTNEVYTATRNLVFCPDQTEIYGTGWGDNDLVYLYRIEADGHALDKQPFGQLQQPPGGGWFYSGGLCVDTNGWLYVATSLGIQVLDQAGRVNFIIPTPKPPHDVCFGGKDLSDLFIACGDTIYKRPTKAHGYISGQMAPIKPPAPKL